MRELQGSATPPASSPRAKKTTTASNSADYEVEVFDGAKKSITKF